MDEVRQVKNINAMTHDTMNINTLRAESCKTCNSKPNLTVRRSCNSVSQNGAGDGAWFTGD